MSRDVIFEAQIDPLEKEVRECIGKYSHAILKATEECFDAEFGLGTTIDAVVLQKIQKALAQAAEEVVYSDEFTEEASERAERILQGLEGI